MRTKKNPAYFSRAFFQSVPCLWNYSLVTTSAFVKSQEGQFCTLTSVIIHPPLISAIIAPRPSSMIACPHLSQSICFLLSISVFAGIALPFGK
jgi:hypothetical protein